MSRAGDARVVVADGLIAVTGELGVVEVKPGLGVGAQVGFDGRLVLRRGGMRALAMRPSPSTRASSLTDRTRSFWCVM
jgi:hypothetical protein